MFKGILKLISLFLMFGFIHSALHAGSCPNLKQQNQKTEQDRMLQRALDYWQVKKEEMQTQTWVNFRSEMKQYWQGEIKFWQQPKPINRIRGGVWKLLKHGVKVRLAENFILFDSVMSVLRAGKQIKEKGDYKRLLLVPVDIIQRNGGHLLTKLAIMASIKWISETFLVSDTNFINVEAEGPPPLSMQSNELVIFVTPKQKVFEKYTQLLMESYLVKFNGDIKRSQLKLMKVDSAEDFFLQLGTLGQRSVIRDIHFAMYSQSGTYPVNSDGLSQILKGNGQRAIGSRDKYKELSLLMQKWPPSLFADNARFFIYAFEREKGEDDMVKNRQFATMTLENYSTPENTLVPWQEATVTNLGVPRYLSLSTALSFDRVWKTSKN